MKAGVNPSADRNKHVIISLRFGDSKDAGQKGFDREVVGFDGWRVERLVVSKEMELKSSERHNFVCGSPFHQQINTN